jgi:translation initiation factor 3 subunit I
MVSGSADNMMKLWSVESGECLFTWEFPTAVKRVAFSEDDTRILAVVERRMGHEGGIQIFRITEGSTTQTRQPERIITPDMKSAKVQVAAWSYLDKYIVTGHEDGKVALFDPKSGEEVLSKPGTHEGLITDLQMTPDGTWFITSSKDKSAKVRSLPARVLG